MLRKHPRTLLPAAIEHLNELLDEALKETFPASDPIAIDVDLRSTQSEVVGTASTSRSNPRVRQNRVVNKKGAGENC
jgi:hypothetical protein